MACGLAGLSAIQPVVHGSVAIMYEIIKISCQSWSSVDVMYVQPPQVSVRTSPIMATNAGSFWPGLRVRRYHKPTRANRGPIPCQHGEITVQLSRLLCTGCDGDKNHEKRSLRVSIADCRGHRGEPFLRITVELVLHDLVIVKVETDYQCRSEERRVGKD